MIDQQPNSDPVANPHPEVDLNIEDPPTTQSPLDGPSQMSVSGAVDWVRQVRSDLSRLYLDKIQEQDQRIKVLSQCIAREVEDNQELKTKIEDLEIDREYLLRLWEKYYLEMSSEYGWCEWMPKEILRWPLHLRNQLLSLVPPSVALVYLSSPDVVEHTQTNTQTHESTETGADIAENCQARQPLQQLSEERVREAVSKAFPSWA